MASIAVATPESAARAEQEKLTVEKQLRINEEAVAKFLANDSYSAIAYRENTLVNNVWPELDYVLAEAFKLQDEYASETVMRVAFLVEAAKALAKLYARSRQNEFEREIDAWSREHKTVKLSREEIALEVVKTRSGKRMQEMALAGKAYIDSLK